MLVPPHIEVIDGAFFKPSLADELGLCETEDDADEAPVCDDFFGSIADWKEAHSLIFLHGKVTSWQKTQKTHVLSAHDERLIQFRHMATCWSEVIVTEVLLCCD